MYPTSFNFHYPRVLPPNAKAVGPILPEPAQPITDSELTKFLEKASGFVLVDFLMAHGFFFSLFTTSYTFLFPVVFYRCPFPSPLFSKVSFGTLARPTAKQADILYQAVKTLNYPVIWKFNGFEAPPAGENLLIRDWIPQNDLLGHPKCRLFVSHGGINGVLEAAYHGVPIAGYPMFADQVGTKAENKVLLRCERKPVRQCLQSWLRPFVV